MKFTSDKAELRFKNAMVHLHKKRPKGESVFVMRVNLIYLKRLVNLSSVKFADFEKRAKKMLFDLIVLEALKSKMFS